MRYLESGLEVLGLDWIVEVAPMLGPASWIDDLGLKAMFLFIPFIPSALAALGSSTLFRAVVACESRLDDWAPYSSARFDSPWAYADWSARALFRVLHPTAAAVAVRGAGSGTFKP